MGWRHASRERDLRQLSTSACYLASVGSRMAPEGPGWSTLAAYPAASYSSGLPVAQAGLESEGLSQPPWVPLGTDKTTHRWGTSGPRHKPGLRQGPPQRPRCGRAVRMPEAYRADGWMTTSSIPARNCGVSSAGCWQRTRRLRHHSATFTTAPPARQPPWHRRTGPKPLRPIGTSQFNEMTRDPSGTQHLVVRCVTGPYIGRGSSLQP